MRLMFRRWRAPAVTIGTPRVEVMASFFAALGWHVTEAGSDLIVATPGGRFGLRADALAPRLELALNIPDPLDVDEVAEVVDSAGGITMEPLQETVWGGWGFSFNDPDGNTWELGSPWTVTAIDRFLSTNARPILDGPIVALCMPAPRLPKSA